MGNWLIELCGSWTRREKVGIVLAAIGVTTSCRYGWALKQAKPLKASFRQVAARPDYYHRKRVPDAFFAQVADCCRHNTSWPSGTDGVFHCILNVRFQMALRREIGSPSPVCSTTKTAATSPSIVSYTIHIGGGNHIQRARTFRRSGPVSVRVPVDGEKGEGRREKDEG